MNKKKNRAFKAQTDKITDSKAKQAVATSTIKQFNGKRNFRKSKFKDPLSKDSGKMFNDVSYYTKNPGILDAFGKMPFNFILGNSLFSQNNTRPITIGGIFSFCVDYLLSSVNIGESTNSNNVTSILDQVTTIVYTQMRRANAGATNDIEPLDVIISNLLASIDILANAVYCNRLFRIANSFAWKNRMIPRELFTHMGIDYDDFIANQALYRGQYNTIVAQAKTIRTLAEFPFINAYMAEFSSIFKDEDTDTGREQIIFPMKGFHHIYDPVGTQDHPGGTIRYMDKRDITGIADDAGQTLYTGYYRTIDSESPVLMKFSVLLDIMRKQIEALITDADFNLIQADIEKAFGDQSGYIEVDSITESDVIEPIYSGEFMSMFHNAIIHRSPAVWLQVNGTSDAENRQFLGKNYYVNTIYQRSNQGVNESKVGYHFHVVDASVIAYDGNHSECNLIDTNINDPTPEDIVIMTRYKTNLLSVQQTDIPADFRFTAVGQNLPCVPRAASNFITFANCFSYTYETPVNRTVTIKRSFSFVNTQSYTIGTSDVLPYFNMNHYPILWNASGTNGQITYLIQLNNVKWLSFNELEAVNLACFLSLWNLPAKTNIK